MHELLASDVRNSISHAHIHIAYSTMVVMPTNEP